MHSYNRLNIYKDNKLKYQYILDLVPTLAGHYFSNNLTGVELNNTQECLLLGLGLQGKNIDRMAEEMDLQVNNVLSQFHKMIKNVLKYLEKLFYEEIDKTKQEIVPMKQKIMEDLRQELKEDAKKIKKDQLDAKKEFVNEKLLSRKRKESN